MGPCGDLWRGPIKPGDKIQTEIPRALHQSLHKSFFFAHLQTFYVLVFNFDLDGRILRTFLDLLRSQCLVIDSKFSEVTSMDFL